MTHEKFDDKTGRRLVFFDLVSGSGGREDVEYLQITAISHVGAIGADGPKQKIIRLSPEDQERLLGVLLAKYRNENDVSG